MKAFVVSVAFLVALAATVSLSMQASTAVAQSAGGGSSAAGGAGPTPTAWAEQPVEFESGFDEVIAAGDDLVHDTPVHIEYFAAGCVPPAGGVPYGYFLVAIGDIAAASTPWACADYGDTITSLGTAVVFGTLGSDTLNSTRIPNTSHSLIFGFAGNDTIQPVNGNFDAYVVAGLGNDVLQSPAQDGTHGEFAFGGAGDDSLTGSAGPDILVGGPGADSLVGNFGLDELQGGAGNDVLNVCPPDLQWDTMVGGVDIDQYVASFRAGILQDSIYEYEAGETVRECGGSVIVP